ncbi:MAG: hypothetical protein IPI68_11425 [Chitinophagaceae bacterium]|nr:hypothetical protein [Chitinophagaceae bacterium]
MVLHLNAGVQYKTPVSKKLFLTAGVYGTWGQKLSATQDILRETFFYDDNLGEARLDSVSDRKNIKGKITLPSTYTIGFILQKPSVPTKEGGWLIGIDFEQQNWEKYRFYGQSDSVRNKWELRVGGQQPYTEKKLFQQCILPPRILPGTGLYKSGAKIIADGRFFRPGFTCCDQQAGTQPGYYCKCCF